MWWTWGAYALGGAIGVQVARRSYSWWPLFIRAQLRVVVFFLGALAVWSMTSFQDVTAAFIIELASLVVMFAAIATRRSDSAGQAALDGWAVGANSGFWVLPLAGAFVGPTAIAIASLADRFATVRVIIGTILMRKDAPIPQKKSTAWVDQMPALGVVFGLGLRVFTAPPWTATLLTATGPFLAFTGAALFAGSLLAGTSGTVRITRKRVLRTAGLLAVRAAVLLPLFLSGNKIGLVLAVLVAFSAPAFQPASLAFLYGYRSSLVRFVATWGWLLAPIGLVLAMIIAAGP